MGATSDAAASSVALACVPASADAARRIAAAAAPPLMDGIDDDDAEADANDGLMRGNREPVVVRPGLDIAPAPLLPPPSCG